MPRVPTLPLNTGGSIPQLGFGVFQVPPDDTAETVTRALEAGYRSIDTAAAYRNEKGVGEAIAASSIPRHELFITTKVWNSEQGTESTRRAFEASLDRLGLEDVDLYLIHWPTPGRDLYVETWKVLEEIHEAGRARAIGVSNFTAAHLERLFNETDIRPAVNQVELHPRLQQPELRAFHDENGIRTEAWSPLAQGGVLDDPVIAAIAERLDRTAAQVVLRWHLQIGNVVIPKSVTPSRIDENFALFDFELTDDDLNAIGGLDRDERTGPHPDDFNVT